MYAKLKTIIIAFIIIFITAAIMTFPELTLQASIHGLHTWWEIVFPSLLPFFIMAELLISFGVVQFFGVLFEPVMRPLFNVPGAGSFAWILGMVSGFPSGAKMTVRLREKEEVTQIEAERLLSFSNAASPLFIFGAIAIGLFHHIQLGIMIALSHYVSNIIVGVMMKYYPFRKRKSTEETTTNIRRQHLIRRGFRRMHHTRIRETRPFGQLFGDAVLTSMQTLLMIGGFIILFSVLTSLLQQIQVIDFIQLVTAPILAFFHISTDIIPPLINGLFEITIGAKTVSQTTTISFVGQLMLLSFIISFNGLSIQAQVASLIAKTDIRFRPYLFARFIHAVIASFFIFCLYEFHFKHKLETVDTTSTYTNFFIGLEKIIAAITKGGPIFTLISLFVATAILANRWIRSI